MKKLKKGFTLIEIAMVLVIIGLILGGILQGQQLINAARVRALSGQLEEVSMAWFAFQDRYHAFPGDFSQASTQIGDVANGNGNGIIDSDIERGLVWLHLAKAGFLSGAYDGMPVKEGFRCADSSCPVNPFGGTLVISGSDQAHGKAGLGLGHLSNELWAGRLIPVAVLAEVDRKLDDGLATAGRLQLAKPGSGWTGSDACLLAANYNIAASSQDCAAVYRGF